LDADLSRTAVAVAVTLVRHRTFVEDAPEGHTVASAGHGLGTRTGTAAADGGTATRDEIALLVANDGHVTRAARVVGDRRARHRPQDRNQADQRGGQATTQEPTPGACPKTYQPGQFVETSAIHRYILLLMLRGDHDPERSG